MKIKVSLTKDGKFYQTETEAMPVIVNRWKRKFAIHDSYNSFGYAITDVKTGLQAACGWEKGLAIALLKKRLKKFTEKSFSKWADDNFKLAKSNKPMKLPK